MNVLLGDSHGGKAAEQASAAAPASTSTSSRREQYSRHVSSLTVSRDESASMLAERIGAGELLLSEGKTLADQAAHEAWNLTRHRWVKLTIEALRHAYADEDEATEFNRSAYPQVSIGGGFPDWRRNLEWDLRYVTSAMNTLESLRERLRFATEPATAHRQATPTTPAQGSESIFVVHGRDQDARNTVARFLERAGDRRYDPVILDEQASRGRTLIEKFEEHASNARYAVVLLTGDDVGGLKGATEQRPRARQNVIFELGFFFGVLGRDRVAVLYESDLEIPSDVDGLAYIPFEGDWQQRLVRELRAAGLDFSMDRV